tara:strand:+ start:395 stop:1105 length:711 start_codon:yes stop_codon:yes gene_type:complete
VHKYGLLRRRYAQVVQSIPDSEIPQQRLAEKMQQHGWYKPEQKPQPNFADLIANLSLQVADDLCLMETDGAQRLIAASVCSPSYWNVQQKIGLSMAAIHQPVRTLQTKIGDQIQRFIQQAPLMTPFERSNWFVHGDRERLHLSAEGNIAGPPEQWFLRSERETLCRFSDGFLLFTINVRFAPLRDISQHPKALADLKTSLARFDLDEIDYFGGADKFHRLLNYLSTRQASIAPRSG